MGHERRVFIVRGGDEERENPRRLDQPDVRSNAVRVSNLHFEVSEEDLRCLFESVGTVRHVHIDYDRSGRSNGTAKVIFGDSSQANEALKRFEGIPLDGQSLHLELAPLDRRVGPTRRFRDRSPLRRIAHYERRAHTDSDRHRGDYEERDRLDHEMDEYMSQRRSKQSRPGASVM